jgi:hypothetical protein
VHMPDHTLLMYVFFFFVFLYVIMRHVLYKHVCVCGAERRDCKPQKDDSDTFKEAELPRARMYACMHV